MLDPMAVEVHDDLSPLVVRISQDCVYSTLMD